MLTTRLQTAFSVQALKDVLNRAKANRPDSPDPTASGFADWIFRLQHPVATEYRNGAIQRGLDLHRYQNRKLRHKREVLSRYPSDPALEVIYEDDPDNPPECLTSSVLTVNGTPLRGKPDRIVRDRRDSSICIFEFKYSRYAMPIGGWPNLRAQLWCYGWMDIVDRWSHDEDIALVGQVYRPVGVRGWELVESTPCWSRSDKETGDLCGRLFNLYGGEVHLPPA